jgi:hypothetical protein
MKIELKGRQVIDFLNNIFFDLVVNDFPMNFRDELLEEFECNRDTSIKNLITINPNYFWVYITENFDILFKFRNERG